MQEGSWNKIGILQKLLSIYTAAEVEWILWMEPDAIFDDPSFTIPFEFYQGMDIVTVANPQKAADGDQDGKGFGNTQTFRSLHREEMAKCYA